MFKTLKINNDKGIILLTVIMLTIVLSVVAIGIMGVNVSQVRSSQSIVDNIKAEQLAIGVFYLCHQQLSEGKPCTADGTSETIGLKIFDIDVLTTNSTVNPNNPNGTTEYAINITYF